MSAAHLSRLGWDSRSSKIVPNGLAASRISSNSDALSFEDRELTLSAADLKKIVPYGVGGVRFPSISQKNGQCAHRGGNRVIIFRS
jgi:hypothetical protein